MAERISLDTGAAMLLDALGAHRYLLTAGMAAELIAELVVAGEMAAKAGSPLAMTGGDQFVAELQAAITQRRDRLARGTE